MSAAQVIPYEELQQEAAPWPLQAVELNIADQASMDAAGRMLHDIKLLRSRIAETFDPLIKKAHELHKAEVARKRELEAELVEAEGTIKRKVSVFVAAQERRAREQAAIEEAARREEQKKAEEEATQLEAMGEPEMAEAVRETADEQSAPLPVPAVPKARGVQTRDNWKAEVTDMKALVAAVAAGEVPIAVLKVDTKVLGQQARSLKKELAWPGVRVWNDKVVATR